MASVFKSQVRHFLWFQPDTRELLDDCNRRGPAPDASLGSEALPLLGDFTLHILVNLRTYTL